MDKRDKDHEYGLKYSVRVAGGVVRTQKWYTTAEERNRAFRETHGRLQENLISIRRIGK